MYLFVELLKFTCFLIIIFSNLFPFQELCPAKHRCEGDLGSGQRHLPTAVGAVPRGPAESHCGAAGLC